MKCIALKRRAPLIVLLPWNFYFVAIGRPGARLAFRPVSWAGPGTERRRPPVANTLVAISNFRNWNLNGRRLGRTIRGAPTGGTRPISIPSFHAVLQTLRSGTFRPRAGSSPGQHAIVLLQRDWPASAPVRAPQLPALAPVNGGTMGGRPSGSGGR